MNRYAIESRSKTPQHNATPPRSPNKPLPTAPERVARTATSQKYTKTSVSRSENNSSHPAQSHASGSKSVSRKEVTHSPKSPEAKLSPRHRNVGWFIQSPDSAGARRSSPPEQIAQTREQGHGSNSSEMGLGINPATSSDRNGHSKGQALSRSTKSPEPPRSIKSPEPHRPIRSPQPSRGDGPEDIVTSKTPAQIMARLADVSKSAIPERPPSPRQSLTEPPRSLLGKGRPSKTSDDKYSETGTQTGGSPDTTHSTTLPIQSPVEELETNSPPGAEHLGNQLINMSANSASPASQLRREDTPSPEESNPQHCKDGKPLPAQTSYNSFSPLPTQPELSPLQNSFSTADLDRIAASATKEDANMNRETPTKISIVLGSAPLKSKVSDDSEGDVNATHPLLREERHARFATRTTSGTLSIKSPLYRPLRHYYSETDFAASNPESSERQMDGFKGPRRSSSLLYQTETHSTQQTPTEPKMNNQIHPSSHQITPNSSALNLPRANNLPVETDLGIHPAHRTLASNVPHAKSPTPDPSDSSSTTEQGATPPPILTGPAHYVSPPSRFAPTSAPRPLSPNVTQSPQRNARADSPGAPNPDNQAENSDPKQTPFYLNPASSSALIDFLATTPPPSPPPGVPREAVSTEPGSPQSASTTGFFNRPFIPRNTQASPPPPTSGALPSATWSGESNEFGNGNLNDVGAAPQRKFSNWKRVFRGTKVPKERKARTGKKKIAWGKDAIAESLEGPTYGKKKEKEKDFIGVSQNGVWLSRSNFLRS